MPAPVMWDTQTDAQSGEHTNTRPVKMELIGSGDEAALKLTPDADWLTSQDTQYPVTVDPSTSKLSDAFDTYVQRGESVDKSTDTELDFGNPGTKNGDGSDRTARSFIHFNTKPIKDSLVSKARLSLFNFHSGNTDCKPYGWTVWATGKASTKTRWTSQPEWKQKYATSTDTKGNPGCGKDGWIHADVTKLAKDWASAGDSTSALGLRAETDSAKAWKRVNSGNSSANQPKLEVTYNYRPGNGHDPKAGPPFEKNNDGIWKVNTLTPKLQVTFDDADGDKVNGTFEVRDAKTDKKVGDYLVSDWTPAGKPAEVTVPAGVLKNSGTYKFRASSYDGTHYDTGWSKWETFTVDAKDTGNDVAPPLSVENNGKPGQFTVTLPDGGTAVEWRLDGGEWTRVNAAAKAPQGTAAATTRQVTIDTGATDAGSGDHTLDVRTVNAVGAVSQAVSHAFTGNGTTGGNAEGDAVDLTLPDPDLGSQDPNQKFLQDYTDKVTKPHDSPNVLRGDSGAAKEQCGPVGKDGTQACFGPSIPLSKAPKDVRDELNKPAAAPRAAAGVECTKFADSAGITATRFNQCETKVLPFVKRKDGVPIGGGYFKLIRELQMANSEGSFTQHVTRRPANMIGDVRSIEILMADQMCLGHNTCEDPGKADISQWKGTPIWWKGKPMHSATLTTKYKWDNSAKDAEYDFYTDFRLAARMTGLSPAGNTTGYQWRKDKPSRQGDIRCDTKHDKGGCVLVNVAPTYHFNASKHPQAAAHAWLIQNKLPTHPGSEEHGKPLYYMGDKKQNTTSRNRICKVNGKSWANQAGDKSALNPGTDELNCDEFAFASTYNSGGMSKAEGGLNPAIPAGGSRPNGKACVQTFVKASGGAKHMYNVKGHAPTWDEVCGRSAMSGKQNQGSMQPFGQFITEMRLMDKDAYWLDPRITGDCKDDEKAVRCTMSAS